ncbi:hypothetical protein RIR_e3758_A0A2I1GIW4_9GLOM [Rhizophagus irregularis DAOM 181602=DAOM 197198]|uniref:Uncharacterized protein n=1 Tax=Rhizophagus irregularis TaxID=588596 RepID=A0A2I1GIW4_9GLOM|nr:hypothetical protein RhiirA4_190753 [Rhizophagus irregularis]GET50071.1 hypothetical protein RIR_e3758_A0A2I1GIW4_9GLOM [Rhizophagus irregularis DAOM 181602=DAOM 197198]
MSILWKYFLCAPLNFKQEIRKNLYNTITHFLPNDPEDRIHALFYSYSVIFG